MSRIVRWADSVGALGATFAALCCAGPPVIVGALAAAGLSSVRDDRILWPLMGLSLVVALWGFTTDRRTHGRTGPLVVALAGSVALVVGVVFVHGPPARLLINAGGLGLLVATAWNVWVRTNCRSSPPPAATTS